MSKHACLVKTFSHVHGKVFHSSHLPIMISCSQPAQVTNCGVFQCLLCCHILLGERNKSDKKVSGKTVDIHVAYRGICIILEDLP